MWRVAIGLEHNFTLLTADSALGTNFRNEHLL